MGLGALLAGRLSDLLLLAVEGHQYVGQSGVVHRTVSVRGAVHSADPRHYIARLRGRHQILSQSELQCHLQGRGVGGCCDASVLFAGTRIRRVAGLRIVQ